MAWQIESITHDCSLSSAFISLYSELYSDLEGLFLTKLQLFGRVNANSPLCWQQGPSSRELSYRHTSKMCVCSSADCCTELPHLGCAPCIEWAPGRP